MSLLIGEAAADDATEQLIRPRGVIEAVCLLVAIPEIELREIAVQMLLGAPLVHAQALDNENITGTSLRFRRLWIKSRSRNVWNAVDNQGDKL